MWVSGSQENYVSFEFSKKLVAAVHLGDGSASLNTPTACCVCGRKEKLKKCGKCKFTSYCSKNCQLKHLSYHSKYCSAISDLQKLEMDKLYRNYSVREEQMDDKNKIRIMKLIGEKPMLNCRLDNKNFELLWDTGSMISLVDKMWVKKHFPEKQIHSVNDFLENENLHVQAVNSAEIKIDGVILLNFSLKADDEGFVVPVLVASQGITEPILGYNVIEHLILNETAEDYVLLASCLKSTGPFNIEPLVALIQAKAKTPDLLAEIKASNTITIPAGNRVQIKCRVKVSCNDCEQTVYFAPRIVENGC